MRYRKNCSNNLLMEVTFLLSGYKINQKDCSFYLIGLRKLRSLPSVLHDQSLLEFHNIGFAKKIKNTV